MSLDLTDPRQVVAGNAYGECSGGGRPGMENVTSVVLHRLRNGWAPTLIGVCLAPAQFSCWADVNRARIERAAVADPAGWMLALDIADAAIAGTLPDRTCGADSYYALSMRHPAYWARSPARHVFSDRWHTFWTVHPARAAPNLSVQATDDLNEAELAQLAGSAS